MEPFRRRLERPALEDAAPGPGVSVTAPRAARAMCLMTDGTWTLVHTLAAAPLRDGQWAARIRWNVAGKAYDGWFVHNPGRLLPVVPGEPFPELRRPG